jgi:hypothetical protein
VIFMPACPKNGEGHPVEKRSAQFRLPQLACRAPNVECRFTRLWAEVKGEMIRYRAKRPWMPEEDNRLRTLLEEGASTVFVAAKLKRTVSAIKGRAHVIGMSFRRIKLGLKAKRK